MIFHRLHTKCDENLSIIERRDEIKKIMYERMESVNESYLLIKRGKLVSYITSLFKYKNSRFRNKSFSECTE